MYESTEQRSSGAKWIILGVLVLVAAGALVVGLLSGSKDEESTSTTFSAPADSSADTQAPVTPSSPATPAGRLPVGETAVLDGGAVARVRLLVPDAPPPDDFSAPAPGFSLTRVVVEQCAGSESLLVNPLYWTAFDENGVALDASIFSSDLAAIEVLAGGCVSGALDFEIADGTSIASVVLTDMVLTEVARWDTASSVPVDSPLASGLEPVTLDRATVADIENGGTAEVVSVRMNVPVDDTFFAPPAGWQLVELTVRMCAGTEQLMVNPQYWHLVTRANYVASASINSGSLMFVDLVPGECISGTMIMELPSDAVVKHVVLTDVLFTETARWATS